MDLAYALDNWTVFCPEDRECKGDVSDWWAVANEDGICAYFNSEDAAFRYRLFMINRDLNP